MAEVKTKDRIPLWLAVAITVAVALPFGIYLGKWNLPIWVSFIVWAEYFQLGAKPKALETILPAYAIGVLATVTILTVYVWLNSFITAQMHVPGDISLFLSFFFGFCVFIYWMKYIPVTVSGSLPYFNGITMTLAVFFTGAFLAPFPADISAYALPAIAGFGALLGGLLGAFLGWFNVTIQFPRVVSPAPPAVVEPPAPPQAPSVAA